MMLSIQGIRFVATRHNYEEINFNETSKMISFRGGIGKSTRINVYYTTGTVGTCLNHPKKGKTQLFRRGVSSLEQLEEMFENQRLHTGDGYYNRSSIKQPWKRGDTNETIPDSARRWVYVGNATGLFHCQSEMDTVVEICTL